MVQMALENAVEWIEDERKAVLTFEAWRVHGEGVEDELGEAGEKQIELATSSVGAALGLK